MNKFKISSRLIPTGGQPRAIEKLYNNLKNNEKYQTLLGITGSGKTFTMAQVIAKRQKPALIISHNKTLAAQLALEFQSFFPKNAVHYFVSYYDYYQPEAYMPTTDTYIAKDAQINDEIDRLRHAATSSLLSRPDVIICASVSCIFGLGSPKDYKDEKIGLKKGEKISIDSLLAKLIETKFIRNDIEFKRGTFRVRGDVLEIYPPYSLNKIIRIDFFGDEIEKINEVEFISEKIISELDKISIFPAAHYAAPGFKIKSAQENIKEDLKIRIKELEKEDKKFEASRLRQKTFFDLEMMSETGTCDGIENYSRYFDGRKPGGPPFTLLNYFPDDFLMFIDESHMTIPQINGMYFGDKSRKDKLVDFGFRLPSAYDNRPLKFREFEDKINQAIFISATPGPYEKEKTAKFKSKKLVAEQLIRPTGLLDPTIEIKPTKNQIDDLLEKIQERTKRKERVLVTTLTKKLAEHLSEYLAELGIKVQYLHSEIETFDRLEILKNLRSGLYDVVVGINLLREGLDLPEVSLVAILDADKEGFLRSYTALIQTMGRAARHINGHTVMYADKITKSMEQTIAETRRRRKIQEEYNKKHNITPKSIIKKILEFDMIDKDYKKIQKLPSLPRNIQILIKEKDAVKIKEVATDLKNQMDLASKNLEFEKAAVLRDEIKKIEKVVKK